jgi:hypothetical protein
MTDAIVLNFVDLDVITVASLPQYWVKYFLKLRDGG